MSVVLVINFRKKSSVVLKASGKGVLRFGHFVRSPDEGFPASCWLYVLSISLPMR